MKIQHLLLVIVLIINTFSANAQSYAFGVKGGLTVGLQKWDGFDQDPLFKYHGIAFIESAPEEDKFSVFAQSGFHLKGSAIRSGFFLNPFNNQFERAPTQEFIFRNISLTFGGKQKAPVGESNLRWYYMFGIRGEYTVNTNLKDYEAVNRIYPVYPIDEFVRHFNYGATVGGGLEFPFSEFIRGLLEVSVSPDFSIQYQQPPIANVRDPFGQLVTIQETNIRNTVIELSLGVRFLRKIEYID